MGLERALVPLGALAVMTVMAAMLSSRYTASTMLLQGLAPLISTRQANQGKQLFAESAVVDQSLEKQEGAELSAMNKRLALAQKKLALDQAKVKDVLHRIRRVKKEDVIPHLQLGARAGYRVDVKQGITSQTHPGYRQQSWPRGFSAGVFDFPEDQFQVPASQLHAKDGDAVLDELQAGGRAHGLTKQEKWAERVLAGQ